MIAATLRHWLDEFVEAHRYVVDPHGWHRRYRLRQADKFGDRPAIYQAGDSLVCHPVLYANLKPVAGLTHDMSAIALFGPSIFVSLLAVEHAPSGGWADVILPERPRLAP